MLIKIQDDVGGTEKNNDEKNEYLVDKSDYEKQ